MTAKDQQKKIDNLLAQIESFKKTVDYWRNLAEERLPEVVLVKTEYSSVTYYDGTAVIGNTMEFDHVPLHWLEYGEHTDPCDCLIQWNTYSDCSVVPTLITK